MNNNNFLCGRCLKAMCNDCKEIAGEYQELLERRTRALLTANDQVERLEQEIKALKRERDMYKDVSGAGLGEIIGAWMNDRIGALLKNLG